MILVSLPMTSYTVSLTYTTYPLASGIAVQLTEILVGLCLNIGIGSLTGPGAKNIVLTRAHKNNCAIFRLSRFLPQLKNS